MAGIYIHIPFCRKACLYCNFHFSTSLQELQPMVNALQIELQLRQNYIQEPIETIYFGGGTPSLLPIGSLRKIILAIRQYYNVIPDAEITIEANPDDINLQNLQHWINLGINRLSIGVQSMFNKELRWMNRAHNEQQSIGSIKQAQDNGIENISIDLIYGTSSLNDANWLKTLQTFTSLNIPHLSCYALTVEEKTTLHYMIQRHKATPIDENKQANQFLQLTDFLTTNGYEHYEISNFSKPGWQSKHNTSYWQGKPYLGIGPSAHSFNGTSRQWNIANNALYIQSLQQQSIPFTIEQLTPIQQLNEYIMTSIRTMDGINMEYITNTWGKSYIKPLKKKFSGLIKNKWIKENTTNQAILTQEGKLRADGIASQLFFEEEIE